MLIYVSIMKIVLKKKFNHVNFMLIYVKIKKKK